MNGHSCCLRGQEPPAARGSAGAVPCPLMPAMLGRDRGTLVTSPEACAEGEPREPRG